MQRQAGNQAVMRALAVQRWEMREYQGVAPPPPYTTIHFRYDDIALPAWPHEHVHITVQNDNDQTAAKVHYYYDGWTNTWRRTGGGNVLGASLAQVQAAAIAWAEPKANADGVQFRPPAAAPVQAPVKASDFPELGGKTPKEIEREAKAKAKADQLAELKRQKQEAARLKQEQQKAERAARIEAAEKARLAKAARDAQIAHLGLALHLAFDISMSLALERAAAVVDGTAERETPRRQMSEDALSMYG